MDNDPEEIVPVQVTWTETVTYSVIKKMTRKLFDELEPQSTSSRTRVLEDIIDGKLGLDRDSNWQDGEIEEITEFEIYEEREEDEGNPVDDDDDDDDDADDAEEKENR